MEKIGFSILIIVFLLLFSCEKNNNLRISGSFSEFTTDISVIIYDVSPKDTAKAFEALEKARGIFSYFNSEMNSYDESSALSKLNMAEAGVKTEVPVSLRRILDISRNIHEYTDGAFDVAVLPLVDLWRKSITETGSIPSKEEISRILSISNLECYVFENDSFTVADPLCRIGLGGIAKGYAADSVSAYLKSRGFSDHIVDAGGDMTVFSKTPRMIGIVHPRRNGEMIDTLFVSAGSVATSGDYEKYFDYEGVRYSHIINPFTGYGISDCAAVTVVSEKAYLSDAFATAVMVMGREKGRILIKDNNLSGIIYYLNEAGEVESERINMSGYMKTNCGGGAK